MTKSHYFYKNLQGDVIAITDDMGATVARYTYDAWGKVLTVKDASGNNITSTAHIANINPFRYRSYYYDTETSLYYLQSRYYNPEVGRFINADKSENFCSTYSVLSNNAFCYCENDPVNETDDQGDVVGSISKILAKMAMGLVTGLLVQLMTDVILTVTAGKARFSTWGTYADAAVGGALDALVNKGLVGNIMVTVVSNILGQIVDLIIGKIKNFDFWRLINSIFDCILIHIIEKKLKIKEPEFIRDIKKEAHGLGVKGKRNLDAYLEAKIKLLKRHNWFVNLYKVIFNIAKEFVKGFFELVKEWVLAIAEYIKHVIKIRNMRSQYV